MTERATDRRSLDAGLATSRRNRVRRAAEVVGGRGCTLRVVAPATPWTCTYWSRLLTLRRRPLSDEEFAPKETWDPQLHLAAPRPHGVASRTDRARRPCDGRTKRPATQPVAICRCQARRLRGPARPRQPLRTGVSRTIRGMNAPDLPRLRRTDRAPKQLAGHRAAGLRRPRRPVDEPRAGYSRDPPTESRHRAGGGGEARAPRPRGDTRRPARRQRRHCRIAVS